MSTLKVDLARVAGRSGRYFIPYLFIAASVVYLAVFAGLPVLTGVGLSFTDTKLLRPTGGEFIGADNYIAALTGGTFLKSVWTTLVYSFFTVVGSLLFGTVAALVLNRAFPGRAFARAVVVMPWAVPTVAVVLVFRWIFNDSAGVANGMLSALGIGARGWLTDPQYGMLSVLIATMWKVSPFVMLVVLAALQSIPEELYEATRIDGANAHNAFRFVVLPFLLPTLRVVGLLVTIWSFRRFEIIWLLTGGGPVDATNTVVIDVYRQAFNFSQLGFAAAVGMLGIVLSLVVTFVYFLIERRSERQKGMAA
jgi:multiple sugar transport system permease protein